MEGEKGVERREAEVRRRGKSGRTGGERREEGGSSDRGRRKSGRTGGGWREGEGLTMGG